jgi:inosine-uridine nucleoside N-ribohydrolase
VTRVLIDCDPGIDDAIALFLAFASPELAIRGVSTVAGNVSVDQAFDNATRLCDLAGAAPDLPILKGHRGPIGRVVRHPDEPVHGPGGIGGVTLAPSDRVPPRAHAVDWLAEQLADGGRTTVVALGPLTNIAALLHGHPEAAAGIEEIVLMGGAAFAPGNITPVAEFNFYADPEAARYVTEAGVPLRVVPLDATRKARLLPADLEPFAASTTPAAVAAHRMLEYLVRDRGTRRGLPGGAVHDVVAVAAVLWPDLLEWEDAHVTVECGGEFTRGALIVDVYGRFGCADNARVATGVDLAEFRTLLLNRIAGR